MIEISARVQERLNFRLQTEEKVCNGPCGRKLPLRDFYIRIRSKRGNQWISVREACKKCHNSATVNGAYGRPANLALSRYKKSARVRGLECTLTLEEVKKFLNSSCSYCECSNLMMTIDRADNNVGYTPENSVSACIRCNILKADMPKLAWEEMIPVIREINKRGLFGDWIGRNFQFGRGSKHKDYKPTFGRVAPLRNSGP